MSSRLVLSALIVSFVLPATSCTVRGGGGGGGDDDDDDVSDDDDATPAPETDCLDGLDNDEDTLADCDDPDCIESEASCSWPTAMQHATLVEFDGWRIEDCWWGTSSIDVPDCTTDVTAPIVAIEAGDLCTACDRTFTGAFTYNEDSCSELLDTAAPTEATFGFVFTSATSWDLWGKNDAGIWEFTSELTDDGTGTFRGLALDTINEELDDFGCPRADIGELSIAVSFTPTP